VKAVVVISWTIWHTGERETAAAETSQQRKPLTDTPANQPIGVKLSPKRPKLTGNVTPRIRPESFTDSTSPADAADAASASALEYPKQAGVERAATESPQRRELDALQAEYPKRGDVGALHREYPKDENPAATATEYPKTEDLTTFAVFDALSDIVCITTIDGTLRFLNRAGLDLLGVMDHSRLVGCVFPAHTPAARTLLIDELVPAALQRGHATSDTALQTADGRVFPARQTVVVTAATPGRPTTLTIVIRDVSIERHAAARVAESQRLFEMITRASPDVLSLYDPVDERIVWLNRCPHAFLGGSERDARTLSHNEVTRLVHRDDRAQFRDHAARMTVAYSDSDVLTHEARMRTPGGNWRWIHTRTSVFSRRENGDPLLLLGVATDITVRKAVEQRLVAARDAADEVNRTRAEFVTRMTHEFRASLDAVVGRTTEVRLDRDRRLTAREHAHLDAVLADALRLLKTISDLHDFSAIEMGALDIEQVVVDVRDVLRDTVAAFSDHPRLTQTPIELVIPATEAPLLTDPTRLRQALTHLIANALNHTADGWISVTLRMDDAGITPVAIDVEDSGTGIARDRQLSLFEPFELGASCAIDARSDHGTGLGLATTRALCESMGCALSLAWSEPSAGSTFRLTMPAPSRAARLAGAFPMPTIRVTLV
jgi:PAS domain S-box-containing protein